MCACRGSGGLEDCIRIQNCWTLHFISSRRPDRLTEIKITINRSASRASINRIRSELGEAQARDNVHALELVEDEFTCVRNLDRGHVAVGPAILAPAGVANESALIANMAQEFVCGRKMVAI